MKQIFCNFKCPTYCFVIKMCKINTSKIFIFKMLFFSVFIHLIVFGFFLKMNFKIGFIF